jgi:hypothetical protein
MSRPPTLTPEDKLKRQRERWRRKKTRQRKETADSQWLRATNYGWIAKPTVFHLDQLAEYLVCLGLLDDTDAENPPRVEEAVDDLMLIYVKEKRENEYCLLSGPDQEFCGRSGSGIGEVRVKVTLELVQAIGLENECDNHHKITTAIEEVIYAFYSNIADLRRPSPWPTKGTVWTRPLWSPLYSHRTDYLRRTGILVGDKTIFRQDEFDPGDGDGLPPGGMHDADGLMTGKRARARTEDHHRDDSESDS